MSPAARTPRLVTAAEVCATATPPLEEGTLASVPA